MSTRLQVVIDDEEMEEIRWAARRQRVTVSEWVRQALRQAREGAPTVEAERKLAALRKAMTYDAPTADIDQMLAEIEAGRRGERL